MFEWQFCTLLETKSVPEPESNSKSEPELKWEPKREPKLDLEPKFKPRHFKFIPRRILFDPIEDVSEPKELTQSIFFIFKAEDFDWYLSHIHPCCRWLCHSKFPSTYFPSSVVPCFNDLFSIQAFRVQSLGRVALDSVESSLEWPPPIRERDEVDRSGGTWPTRVWLSRVPTRFRLTQPSQTRVGL